MSADVAFLASAVVALLGLGTLVRAIWRVATVLRDNTIAIEALTKRLDEMGPALEIRFTKLSDRVYQLESREFGRHPADAQPGAPDHYPGAA